MQELITLSERHENEQAKTQRQHSMIAQYALPLITLTTYLPNSMVNSDSAEQVFQSALDAVQDKLDTLNTKVVKCVVTKNKAGAEAMLAVSGLSSTSLKKAMIQLEKEHPLGALINADVQHQDGKTISRKSGFLAPRRCLLCSNAAIRCAAGKTHTDKQLSSHIQAMLQELTPELPQAIAC